MTKQKEKKDVKVDIEVVETVSKAKAKTKAELKQELLDNVKQKAIEVDQLLKTAEIEDIDSGCYIEMDNYIGMVKVGASYGAIIEGAGGTGKTWRVIKHLQGCNYAYTDSFTTPQALYVWMYQNKDADVLVVDDVAGFLDDLKVLAFLKGGLWYVGDSKNRIVHYMTSKPLKDGDGMYVPNSFVLDARMVIITNKLNRKNTHLNAILTRVNHCYVKIPFEEMMHIMEQVAHKDYLDLDYHERMEVFTFLRENITPATENLSIRTLIKCFQQKVYSNLIKEPDRWKMIAMLSLLKKNPALVVIDSLLKDKSIVNEEDRIKLFCSKTGMSRPTYYRLRGQLKETGDNSKE